MKDKKLRIIKKLPQIYLPENRKEMLLKWYDEDLRFQDEIPKTFERGYLLMDNFYEIKDAFNLSLHPNIIKKVAKEYKMTYKETEQLLLGKFINQSSDITIYFEFRHIFLYIDLYFNDEFINTTTIDISKTDKNEPNPKLIEVLDTMIKNGENLYSLYAYQAFIYLQCVLWYLATTTKTTKYYREGEKNQFYHEKKEIINPKKNKYITTPIYDMGKIRKVKVEGLIKRRKGWTYSHSFQVHGHYRHYKDGKTIFIEPYIKGKGKEEITQKIIINPKEEK